MVRKFLRRVASTALATGIAASVLTGLTAETAAAAGCTNHRYLTTISDGTSRVSVSERLCDGNWQIYGWISDIKGDSRSAKGEIWLYNSSGWRYEKEVRTNGNGSGTSISYTVNAGSSYSSGRVFAFSCNTWGCSSGTDTYF